MTRYGATQQTVVVMDMPSQIKMHTVYVSVLTEP